MMMQPMMQASKRERKKDPFDTWNLIYRKSQELMKGHLRGEHRIEQFIIDGLCHIA